MTRLAILADIHGNLPALEAVIDDLARFEVDSVVVAGDVINWGPFSPEVMERVTGEGWAVLRGNNEFYLLDYKTPRAPAAWHNRDDYPLLPWLVEQLAGRWHNVIAAWPDSLLLCFPDAPPVRVVHGSPRSASEPIHPITPAPEVEEIVRGVAETTLIAAHTHLAMDRRVGGLHLLNPGSVGVPLDGDLSAAYMLIDGDERGWHATFRRVPFDYAPLFAEFERQRFEERCGVIGRLVVDEFRTARLRLHSFLVWREVHHPGAPATAALLEQFYAADIWEYTLPAYRINRQLLADNLLTPGTPFAEP